MRVSHCVPSCRLIANLYHDKPAYVCCRDIQDKYRLSLTAEARRQIQQAAHDQGLSHTVFIRTQYDVLRRLRTYWVNRFLIHKERMDELR